MLPAFPFHLNIKCDTHSKHTPTEAELAISEIFLRELIEIYGLK